MDTVCLGLYRLTQHFGNVDGTDYWDSPAEPLYSVADLSEDVASLEAVFDMTPDEAFTCGASVCTEGPCL